MNYFTTYKSFFFALLILVLSFSCSSRKDDTLPDEVMPPAHELFEISKMPAPLNQADTIYEGKVVNVHDGDTYLFESSGKTLKVRSFGIDAPELDQAYGEQSAAELRRLVLHKQVYLFRTGVDQYGRTLGVLYLEKDLNLEMIKCGAAWHYSYYDSTKVYKEAEQQARKERVGLWAGKNPIEPYKWRKSKSKSRI